MVYIKLQIQFSILKFSYFGRFLQNRRFFLLALCNVSLNVCLIRNSFYILAMRTDLIENYVCCLFDKQESIYF